ncbi:multidrug efflux pump subunit AcrA (membrane-fusion protein) [Bosea sp. OAE506]|uniref:hypothetical protein n=1 Tax=Bosea sp. OAE506 TaxID=2663870 RepID=UPI00178C03E5
MLATIRKMLTSAPHAPPSAATIAAAIDHLDVKMVEARAALAAADDRRADAVLLGDAAAADVRQTITALAENLTDLTAARDRLVERLASARAAEAEVERQARYDAAKAAAEAASKALRSKYTPAIATLRSLLRQLETAQALAEAANADLPEGAAPIGDPEIAVRGIPWQHAEVISETKVERWVQSGGDPRFPVSIEDEAKLKVTGTDRAVMMVQRPIGGGSVEHTSIPYERVKLIEIVKRPGVGGQVAPQMRDLHLPGLRLSDGTYSPPGYFAGHAAIIALLDEAERPVSAAAAAVNAPEPVTEYRAVPIEASATRDRFELSLPATAEAA